MINYSSIIVLLDSFKKNEFWVGVVFSGTIVFFIFVFYMDVMAKSDEIKHEKIVIKLENKARVLQSDLSKKEDKYSELVLDYSALSNSYKKLEEKQRKSMTKFSKYCDEQRRLIRVIQKDHGLQVRYDMNYEYTFILEKVLMRLFDNAEACYQVTK